MKKTKLFTLLFLAAILLGSSVAFIACSDDDDTSKPTDKYIGTYILQSAIQADADTIDLIVAIPPYTPPYDSLVVHYAPGDTLSEYVQNALFKDGGCDNPLNTRIQLRSNLEAWFVCNGETNELQMGTWFLNDAGDQMTITYPAIQFNIVITNLALNGTSLTGTIGFPFPIDARHQLGQPLPYDTTTINFQLPKAVDVVFDKTE